MPIGLAYQRRQLLGEGIASARFVDPVGSNQQDRPMPQVGSHISQEVDAGRVGPMKVLEEDEGWVVDGELSQELPHFAEERGLIGDRCKPATDEGSGRRGQAWIAPASLEQVEPRTVRRGIAEVVAGTGQDAPAEGTRFTDQVTG